MAGPRGLGRDPSLGTCHFLSPCSSSVPSSSRLAASAAEAEGCPSWEVAGGQTDRGLGFAAAPEGGAPSCPVPLIAGVALSLAVRACVLPGSLDRT